MAFVEFKNVYKKYNEGKSSEIVANRDVSFEIEHGEFCVIVGPSGAGKSTILNILGGMDDATSGEIFIDGKDICKFNKRQLNDYRRFDVGFVFQFYNLIPNLTVLENVELAGQIVKESLSPTGVDVYKRQDVAYFLQKAKGTYFMLSNPKIYEDNKIYPHHNSKFDVEESLIYKGNVSYTHLHFIYCRSK